MTGYYEDPRPDVQALIGKDAHRVLDVGCASGALGASLKARGVPYVAGIEVSPVAAALARARLDEVVNGDLLTAELPFGPATFDWIVFADVLEHVVDPGAALRRYRPYLAPRGRIVASVPNMRFYLVLLRLLFDRWAYTDSGIRDRTHVRVFTRGSLRALLSDEGFEMETLERNFRLFEDQSRLGRAGSLATRVVRSTVAPWLFPNLMAYQYLAVARARRAG